jgi:hypothetical protein
MRVAIIGASKNAERYSNMALKRLVAAGYEVFPVNPALDEIDGIRVYRSIRDLPLPVDTVTLYVGPDTLRSLEDEILALKPGRIIANPGTETTSLAERARALGIVYLEACTLVLLSTGQF